MRVWENLYKTERKRKRQQSTTPEFLSLNTTKKKGESQGVMGRFNNPFNELRNMFSYEGRLCSALVRQDWHPD